MEEKVKRNTINEEWNILVHEKLLKIFTKFVYTDEFCKVLLKSNYGMQF